MTFSIIFDILRLCVIINLLEKIIGFLERMKYNETSVIFYTSFVRSINTIIFSHSYND